MAHPVHAFAAALSRRLEDFALSDPAFMPADEKAAALVALRRSIDQLQALELKLLGASAEVCEAEGHRDLRAWLVEKTSADPVSAARDLHLADALGRFRAVTVALSAGAVSRDQAEVITRALDQLPGDLDSRLLAKAEEFLLGQAPGLTTRQLRVLGRAVLEHIAPDVAERAEAAALEREETRARRSMELRMWRNADGIAGLTEIRIKVPDSVADRFSTYLAAYTAPRHDLHVAPSNAVSDAGPTGARLPHSVARAHAFASLLEAIDPARLPVHGGAATTVMVTIRHDDLQRDLAAAGLLPEERISASQARRLACSAGIIPVVLGGDSEPLDLGRTRRLFSPGQRKALALRDRVCRAEGCTIPATWCEAHHVDPWSRGGRTDLDAGVLLCSWHHHRAHDNGYRTQRLPNGDVRFTRRT